MKFTVDIDGGLLEGIRNRAEGYELSMPDAIKEAVLMGALELEDIRNYDKHYDDVEVKET